MADSQYDDEYEDDSDSLWEAPSKGEETDEEEYEDDIIWEVHHFATNKSKTYTPQFNAIVNPYGLNLDQDWNKKLMAHHGRHPNEYHNYVLESMRTIDSKLTGHKKMEFIAEFNKVKEIITKTPRMLYKDYWRDKK